MLKKIIISGIEHTPGYPACKGCVYIGIVLKVGGGWRCEFEPGTSNCAYPETWQAVEYREGIAELEAGQVGPMGVKCLK